MQIYTEEFSPVPDDGHYDDYPGNKKLRDSGFAPVSDIPGPEPLLYRSRNADGECAPGTPL